MMNLIESLVRESLPMPDHREIWDWAAENVDFGNMEAFKGTYNVENVPWTQEILRAFKNPRVRKICVMMPPQESGKTKAAEVCLSWRICERPAKMAFNAFTNVKAEQWSDTRWKQMVGDAEIRAACQAITSRLSHNRHNKKKRRIIFRDGSFLIIQGAELDANRQSDSVEVQINDECQLWLQPWMTQMHARTRAFKETHKILNIGLGGKIGSEWHQEFLNGNQGEWSHHCPSCDKLFQYRFNLRDPAGSNIHFDKTKVQIRTDGTLDFTEFRPTVYVTCPHCSHRIDYDPELLAHMNLESMRRGDGYVFKNPSAPPEVVSLHANAFAIGRRPWWAIVEPWIKATMGRSVFATSLLQQFITEELAEFWEERPQIIRKAVNSGDYTRREMADPKFWKDEWIRLMAIDNQRGAAGDIRHRWFVCRAFAKDGRSRLVDCGRINEWADLRKKQVELGVRDYTADLPGPWVVCDMQYKPQEVQEICARYKWYGMLGQDTEKFRHEKGTIFAPDQAQDFYFSDERTVDIGFGTIAGGRQVACYYLYSKQKIEDILATLRSGSSEPWEAPRDLEEFCPEYFEHINSHHQVMESTKKGEKLVWRGIGHAPDHLYDCETELVVLALMAGVYRR